MTLENAIRLYKHFVEKGKLAEAKDLVNQRPQILQAVNKEPKDEKNKKSK